MNNSGVVVGSVYSPAASGLVATMWSNGVASDLGLGGGTNLTAINDSGWMAGYRSNPMTYSSSSFVISPQGVVTSIGTLGGKNAFPSSINGGNQVVGYGDDGSGIAHPYTWSASSGLLGLGIPNGYVRAGATGIDAVGDVIVEASSNTTVEGFIWTQASGFSSLCAGFPTTCTGSTVIRINAGGQIIMGATMGGTSRALILTPAPLDTTPPTITYSGNLGTYTIDQQVNITCSVTDPDSSVASSTCQDIVGPATSFPVGVNTYTSTATDPAGNIGTGSVTFTVVVTPSSLANLITQLLPGVPMASSLTAKVDSISSAPNTHAKAGKLNAFNNELAAQVGKSLTQAQADLLSALATYL